MKTQISGSLPGLLPQEFLGKAWDSALVTSSQVILMLLFHRPH